MRPVTVGLQILPFEQAANFPAITMSRWQDVLWLARKAEDLGFDAVWLPDHLVYRVNDEDPLSGSWDEWSMLSALAAMTSRVEIGTMVGCAAFRNPALLAKMANTVDEISGGRLILGLGAGYFEPEFRAFGYPFDHLVSRFEESLMIICSLLRTGRVDFEGKFHSARECELRPRGPRVGGPPILVGGVGPPMLRLVAQHADLWTAWMAFEDSSPEAVPALVAPVDAACLSAGRDPATLGRTVSVRVEFPGEARLPGAPGTPISGEPETLATACLEFARHGIGHVNLFASWTGESLELAARALELLDEHDGSLAEAATSIVRPYCHPPPMR